MPLDFGHLIDTVIKLEAWQPKPRVLGFYRASEYLHCPRSVYWSILDPLPITDKRALRRMRAGQVTEAELVRMTLLHKEDLGFQVLGMQDRVEWRDESGIRIRGRTDQAIRIMADAENAILEYKSTTSLDYAVDQGWIPRAGDMGQLQLYLHMAGVDLGYLIYVDRDDYNCCQIMAMQDAAKLEHILEWYRKVHVNVSANTLPRLEKVEMCDSCQYKDRCEGL